MPGAAFAKASSASQGFYQQTNLVSDIVGEATFTDPNLVNSWGLVHGPATPWWVADNGTGVSTLYNGQGQAFPLGSPLVVTIPPPTGSPAGTTAAATGVIFNGNGGFNVSENGTSFSSLFIFDTEDGTISGWNLNFVDRTHAILAVDRSNVGKGAVYKGLAIGSNASGTFIFATNFRFGTIEMFDSNFNLVRSFTDHRLPQSYAPFGIQNIGGNLYVTFAKQNAAKHDDVAGPGHGFVDVFDTNGNLISRLIARGSLNSPWRLLTLANSAMTCWSVTSVMVTLMSSIRILALLLAHFKIAEASQYRSMACGPCSSVMEEPRAQPTNSSSLPVLMLKHMASSALFRVKAKL